MIGDSEVDCVDSICDCRDGYDEISGRCEKGMVLPFCFCYSYNVFYPFPKQHNSDSAKLKELADDNFKFDENSKMFSKRVEDTVGKGEIAPEGQFLLFPQYFQKF